MPSAERTRVEDGGRFYTFEGGVDSGSLPDIILDNQVAQAINTTFRGGHAETRPPFLRRRLSFVSSATKYAFEDGYFQGAGSFQSDSGRVFLVASISGRLFTTEIANSYSTEELTIPGGINNPRLQKAWFAQAEDTLIVQDAESKPIFWDGATVRRATDDELPVGGPTLYVQGRVWVGIRGTYVGGDIVYGDPAYGRQNVLRFTENTYLNEGGAFSIPRSDGYVTGLSALAAQDSSDGTSGLMVSSADGIYQFDAPTNRDQWKNTTQPLQRFALLEYGALSNESIALVNGDMYFRARDGIRSFKFARRDFEAPGNTPISNEVTVPVALDSQRLLSFSSSVNFSNRLLTTTIPVRSVRGVFHKGIVALDFDVVSKINRKLPPVWDGTWTGLRVLQLLTAKVGGVKRCFAYCLDADLRICLYELTETGTLDNSNTRIEWELTTRELTPDPEQLWDINNGDLWLENATGKVGVSVSYSADSNPCWQPWHSWEECVTTCYPGTEIPCAGWPNYQPASLPRRGLPAPPTVPDEYLKRPYTRGYVFQLRIQCRGKFRLKKGRAVFNPLTEDPRGTVVASKTCK